MRIISKRSEEYVIIAGDGVEFQEDVVASYILFHASLQKGESASITIRSFLGEDTVLNLDTVMPKKTLTFYFPDTLRFWPKFSVIIKNLSTLSNIKVHIYIVQAEPW